MGNDVKNAHEVTEKAFHCLINTGSLLDILQEKHTSHSRLTVTQMLSN